MADPSASMPENAEVHIRKTYSILKIIFGLTGRAFRTLVIPSLETYYWYSAIMYIFTGLFVYWGQHEIETYFCSLPLPGSDSPTVSPFKCAECPASIVMCGKEECYRKAMNVTYLHDVYEDRSWIWNLFPKSSTKVLYHDFIEASRDEVCLDTARAATNPVIMITEIAKRDSDPSKRQVSQGCKDFHCSVLKHALGSSTYDLNGPGGVCTNRFLTKQPHAASNCPCQYLLSWDNLEVKTAYQSIYKICGRWIKDDFCSKDLSNRRFGRRFNWCDAAHLPATTTRASTTTVRPAITLPTFPNLSAPGSPYQLYPGLPGYSSSPQPFGQYSTTTAFPLASATSRNFAVSQMDGGRQLVEQLSWSSAVPVLPAPLDDYQLPPASPSSLETGYLGLPNVSLLAPANDLSPHPVWLVQGIEDIEQTHPRWLQQSNEAPQIPSFNDKLGDWKTQPWSKCLCYQQCWTGIKQRLVTCLADKCKEPKPDERKYCKCAHCADCAVETNLTWLMIVFWVQGGISFLVFLSFVWMLTFDEADMVSLSWFRFFMGFIVKHMPITVRFLYILNVIQIVAIVGQTWAPRTIFGVKVRSQVDCWESRTMRFVSFLVFVQFVSQVVMGVLARKYTRRAPYMHQPTWAQKNVTYCVPLRVLRKVMRILGP